MLDPIGLKHVRVTRSDNYPRDHLARTLFHVRPPHSVPKTTIVDAEMFRGVGLLSTFGAAHTTMRKQLTPHFGHIQRFLPIFQRHARHFLTLDVIGVSAFGFAFGAVDGRLSPELQAFNDVKMPSSFVVNLGIVFFPFWDYLPFASVQRRVAATDTIQDTVYRVIDAKLQAPADRDVTDLLDLLLLSGTSAADARVHVTTFLQAGHETTSGTLAWVLVQIATHADVATRVYAECRDVLHRHRDDDMTSDVLAELPYLTAVIQKPCACTPQDRRSPIALRSRTIPCR
ncbi:hypothetical protein SPRG_03220 [Saprolegnia parasitica CBS 223.65]|uniref:Cytochrome P450 n=1 Tax=Saprolegnia parasitica (strain CBS 223.65) TaxID=695850 RepID=A0A067CNA5_SAPPC|nr:hypothetical protein SPRG_03220 [Saprolegnia parasitica CBS 223.65]KDO32003.1 hypothetical protein SPRG_03220 [Saprolegnia parasitica CBS 223.65]|eukprot:XP_012197197.1 hypothetical protein SPRG_03220 [Saprolegnia parasitica CBS 223.65]